MAKVDSEAPVIEKQEQVDEIVDQDTAAVVVVDAEPKKRKSKRSVSAGQAHISATFNNTIISITDNSGSVLSASSAGACGFRGSKKGTAYAAQIATERAAVTAKQQYGLSKVDVFVKGIGLGRDSAIRTLGQQDIHVETIQDVTGVPHGGVRPRKARRV